jgi:Tol biopolymer transport system component
MVFAHSFGEPYPEGSSLWVMEADGSDPRPLTGEDEGIFDTPGSFSADGSSLLFTRVTDSFELSSDAYVLAESAIYTADLKGGDPLLLAEDGGDPAYSPDGETIAFVSDRDENGDLCYGDRCFFAGELYLMAADGSNQTRVTNTSDLHEAGPAWSPDGERIAFTRGEEVDNAQGTGVFAANPDGSCMGPILFDPKLDTWYSSASWSPGEPGPGPLSC